VKNHTNHIMTQVDLTQFFPWTFILHLARSLLTFNIINAMLKPKKSLALTFFGFVGITMLYSYLSLELIDYSVNIMEYLAVIGYYVTVFLLAFFMYGGKTSRKTFSVFISFAAYFVSVMLFTMLEGLFYGFDLGSVSYSTVTVTDVFTQSIFMFSFSFVFAALLKYLTNRKKTRSTESKLFLIYLFPVTHIINVLILFMAFKIYNINRTEFDAVALDMGVFGFISFILCFAIDILIIFAIDYIEKVQEENLKYEKALMQNQIDYNRIRQLKEEKTAISKIRHDFTGIISTAAGFIELGNYEKALSILTNAGSDVFGSNEKFCHNELINIILQLKKNTARQADTELSFDITESSKLNIDDYDTCRLLNNLIDNSINAAQLTSEKKSFVSIVIDRDEVVVKTKNRFNSTAKRPKRDESKHGFGTKIIKDIAKKYGGKYSVEISGDEYVTVTTLRNCELSVN
jgi:hypothetical protein